MKTYSPLPKVIETVITDDSFLEKDASPHASRGEDVSALSKHAMKAYRRALKAGKAQDVKSRQSCALLRSKREGTDLPFDPVIREEPAAKTQTMLSDF